MTDTAAIGTLLVEVGRAIHLPHFRQLDAADIHAKAHGEVVTTVDRLAETRLREALLGWYPKALVTGEEGIAAEPGLQDEIAQSDHVFLIDPLDGTANFVLGSPDFGILLVEARAGTTQRSWIWQPIRERLFVGDRSTGEVRINGEPVLRPATAKPLRGGVAPAFERLQAPGLAPAEPMMQSCAIDYPLMIVGERDYLVHDTDRPWDHLPGTLQLELLGGRVAFADGTPFGVGVRSTQPLVAATDPVSWAVVASAARELAP